MNKVSVVTICLNEEKNIRKTLESVLNQSYTEIEYIIKDGNSTDKTNEIIKKTIESYPRKDIKHIVQKDSTIYDAMNQAIKHCAGEWIIFINAGDCLANNEVLEKIFNSCITLDGEILYGDAIMKDEDGEMIWKADMEQLPYRMPFCHQSCFIKNSIIQQKNFNVSYRIAADFNMILELYKEGYKFKYIDEIVSAFDMAGVSSNNFVLTEKERFNILKSQGINVSYVSYLLRLLVAQGKRLANLYAPSGIKRYLRRFYKQKIKKYDTK